MLEIDAKIEWNKTVLNGLKRIPDDILYTTAKQTLDLSQPIIPKSNIKNHAGTLRRATASGGVRGGSGAITSNIMRIIDEKIDDGYPLTGSVYGLNGYGMHGHCSNSASNKTLQIYTTDNYTTSQTITDRKKVVYKNDSNQFCVGIMVVGEF